MPETDVGCRRLDFYQQPEDRKMSSRNTKFAAVTIAMLACFPAMATNSHQPAKPPTATVKIGEIEQEQAQRQSQGQTSSNRNSNTATSAATSISEGSTSSSLSEGGAASAEQSQTASADNIGNTQSVTMIEAAVPTRSVIEARTVPTAIAPNIYPTASCAMAASAGASAMGWGASLGGSKVNHECVMLETARVFSQLGYPIQGLDVLCATQTALDVFGSREACLTGGALHEATASPSVVVVPVGVSQKDVTESINRAFKAASSK